MILKILVALDGSRRAPAVFDAAAELALRFDAPIVALRVCDFPPEFPATGAGRPAAELPARLTAMALAQLDAITRNDLRGPVEATLVRMGRPWRTIIDVANEIGADLIVIGSHGYHGIDRVLGTTAGKVANRSRRNVLLVHGGEYL